MDFTGVRILIFQQRGWGVLVGQPLAERFQEEGAVLAAFSFKKSTHDSLESQTQVSYEQIINHDRIVEDPREYLDGNGASVEEICGDLGVKSIWPIVQSLRNYVKSYTDKFYFGFKQERSDEDILLYVQALHKMCRDWFEEFKPDVVVSPNFVSLPHIMMHLYARQRGVSMVATTTPRLPDRFSIATTSYLDDDGSFFVRFQELKEGATSSNDERAREYLSQRLHAMESGNHATRQPSSLLRDYYRLSRTLASSLLGRHRLKGVKASVDHQPFPVVLRDFISRRRYTRRALNFPYYDLSNVGPFVFMPLQVQPESTIDVISPRFNNQIELARQIAMSLPGDLTLVVKEHPAMVGYRPPSYLEKVARTPNVKLVDHRIPSTEILRRAHMVIASSGSAVAEASLLRTPVIQLGGLGLTKLLPNVMYHNNLQDLTDKILEGLSRDIDPTAYDLRLRNYVAAAFDVGTDVRYSEIRGPGRDQALSKIYDMYSKEIKRSLAGPSGSHERMETA